MSPACVRGLLLPAANVPAAGIFPLDTAQIRDTM